MSNDRLISALWQKYGSPERVMARLGLDSRLLDDDPADLGRTTKDNNMASFTRDRGYSRARRMGRDEFDPEELRSIVDDPSATVGEKLAAVILGCPEDQQEELHHAMREIGEDRRGPRSFARDALERRALDRGLRRQGRDRRRYGRDLEPEQLTEPGRPIEEFRQEGEDRRRHRMAGDLALDNSPRSGFARRYPNATRIERF